MTRHYPHSPEQIGERRVNDVLRSRSVVSGNITTDFLLGPELDDDAIHAARASISRHTLLAHGCTGADCVHPDHPAAIADCLRLLEEVGLPTIPKGAAA